MINNNKSTWINYINPTNDDAKQMYTQYNIEYKDFLSALDSDEISRLIIKENYYMIIIDIVVKNNDDYFTTPMSFIIKDELLISVCLNNIDYEFKNNHNNLLIMQDILLENSLKYQRYLKEIDKKRKFIEENIDKSANDKQFIELHHLNSTLVQFATSLIGNNLVFGRLDKHIIKDNELLEEIIIETKQALEMCNVYREIIGSTKDLMATIVNNRLNNIMKLLALITIVMAIPTIIAGLYGMNVETSGIPLANYTWSFLFVCILIISLTLILVIVINKTKYLK